MQAQPLKQFFKTALQAGGLSILTLTFPVSLQAEPASTKSPPSTKEILRKTKQAQTLLLKQQEQLKNNLHSIQQQKRQAFQKAQQDRATTYRLNNDMIRTTQKLHTVETEINQLTQQNIQLKAQINNLDQQLQTESRNFSKFLPLMERLSLYPSDMLLTAPMNSSHSTVGLSIIQTMSRQMEKQAARIQQHHETLEQLKKQLAARINHLALLQKQQQADQNQLTSALKKARVAQQASSKTLFELSQHAEDAAKKAMTINEAIRQINLTKLKAEKQLQEEIRQASQTHNIARMKAAQTQSRLLAASNKGTGLTTQGGIKGNAPVVGQVISLWNSRTDSGPAQGITYAPPSQATVRAPCTGLIEFAGPFRSFGHMIILNCGKNYRFVLAGMDTLSVSIGQNITKGIMIGRMANWSGNGTAGRPTLFIQLKHGDKTINPSPFL